jgi:hypothetical protein
MRWLVILLLLVTPGQHFNQRFAAIDGSPDLDRFVRLPWQVSRL